MSSSKVFTKVEQQTFPKQEFTSITFSRTLNVKCVTKLTVIDNEKFLSNFVNNEFNEEHLEDLISKSLETSYGEIKGTKIEERFVDPDSFEMKKIPGIHV
jgi:hypothetical protein